MNETKKVRIEGDEFELRFFPPKQSIRILVRLLKMVAAPAVRGLSGTPGEAASLLDGNLAFDKIVDGFVANITDDGVIETIEMILEEVLIKTKDGWGEVTLESTFQGKMGTLFGVVKEAVVFNYAEIVKKNLTVLRKAKA